MFIPISAEIENEVTNCNSVVFPDEHARLWCGALFKDAFL
jgi:hypothetical protein